MHERIYLISQSVDLKLPILLLELPCWFVWCLGRQANDFENWKDEYDKMYEDQGNKREYRENNYDKMEEQVKVTT